MDHSDPDISQIITLMSYTARMYIDGLIGLYRKYIDQIGSMWTVGWPRRWQ